jgi:hypothetical protein
LEPLQLKGFTTPKAKNNTFSCGSGSPSPCRIANALGNQHVAYPGFPSNCYSDPKTYEWQRLTRAVRLILGSRPGGEEVEVCSSASGILQDFEDDVLKVTIAVL